MNTLCPKCGSDDTHRIKRPFWMRLFKNSICICCYRCASRSMLRNAVPDGDGNNTSRSENSSTDNSGRRSALRPEN